MTEILSARAVLVPIDVQRAFDDPHFGRRGQPGMEANGLRVLAAWRASGRPIIHVHHDSIVPGSPLAPDAPGNAFREGFEPRAGEPSIGKSVNSAFIGTDLELRLRRLDADTVVFFGLTTDRCVSTSVRMAANLGFRAWLVGDACAAFDAVGPDGRPVDAETLHRAHLATLHEEFATVVDTDALLARLRRVPAAA